MSDKPDWLEQAADLLKERICEEAGDYLAGVPALQERYDRAIAYMEAIVSHWIARGERVQPETDIVSLVAEARGETPEATLERLIPLSSPVRTEHMDELRNPEKSVGLPANSHKPPNLPRVRPGRRACRKR